MFPKEEVPYGASYLSILRNNGIPHDIIYWNRDSDGENIFSDGEIFFNLECKLGGKKIKKIFKMLKYARFIRSILKSKKYSKVIILTTVPGMFTFDILLKGYRNKYIFDIRDYTNESNKIYYYIEKLLIKHSYTTVISSEGFKKFLPQNRNYIKTHNISNQSDIENVVQNIKLKKQLVIGFVGNVRYEHENELLIEQLKNNSKYRIGYWGKISNSFNIESVKAKTNATNISFFGPFINEDKKNIYNNIDFINAIYGTDGLEVTTAVPNRFYDAIIFKKPIITSKGTYLGELVEKSGLGIAVDIKEDNLELLLSNYIASFDPEVFLKRCDDLWGSIILDQEQFNKEVTRFTISD